jgi:phosphate:Na+ symporter
MFPFSSLLVKASELIVKTDGEESGRATKYIDDRLLVTPSIALIQAAKEVLHLGNIAYEQFETAVTAFFNNDEDLAYKVFDLEKKVNDVSKEALEYLVKLDKESMTDIEKDKLVVLMSSINDIERVGDHADNVGEFVLYKIENKVNFSEQAVEEIKAMFDDTMAVFKGALLALKTINCDDCNKVSEIDARIDKAYKILRKNHIERLNNYICEPSAGIIFLDIIGNLERIGDHSSNIAESIAEVITGKDEKK